MSDLSPTVTTDLLLAHERFVHAVARDLLRDEHAAQDVVQDTWVQALQHGPHRLVALRSWLGRVATNRARDVRRATVRRERRERDAMVGAATESVGDTASRLALQRDVVGAVLSLGEPYKSVVLLRYYHDLEPTEIAARLGSKPATVRTQLVRAHEQLRERLDRDHGGRAAWATLLLPAYAEPAAAGSAALKAAAMATMLAIGATGYFAMGIGDPAPPRAPAAVVTATVSPAADAAPDRELAPAPAAAIERAAVQDRAAATIPEVIGARAVLRDYDTHKNYADSAFSFLHAYGGRERRGKDKARNDFDVTFGSNRFRADTVTDDRSLIVDLGLLPMTELARLPLDECVQRVLSAATERYAPRRQVRSFEVTAQLGHTYFVWTEDTNSDHASLFQVVDLTAKDRCVLDWYWTEDGTWARGSLRSPAGARTLAAAALALREVASASLERETGPLVMRKPRIVVQARSGRAGGNPCRIDLGGKTSPYFNDIADGPINVSKAVGVDDKTVGYCTGGLIPKDMRLVITDVTWSGEAHGDSNGGGRFHVQLGDHELVKLEKSDEPIRGSWTGRVELVRGEEDRAFFEISNSSQGEVVFTGKFEPLPK